MHSHMSREFHIGRGEEDDEYARPQVEDDGARAYADIAYEDEKGAGLEHRDGGHDHADTTRVELIEKHAGGEGAWHEEEARPRAEVDGIGGMR